MISEANAQQMPSAAMTQKKTGEAEKGDQRLRVVSGHLG
jgi:hypothetical protein